MLQKLIYIIIAILIGLMAGSCSETEINEGIDFEMHPEGNPVEFEFIINDYPLSRGLLDQSKKSFDKNEIIHIRAEFICQNLENKTQIDTLYQYTVMKCADLGYWNPFSDALRIYWPGNTITANFTAYYLYGSTGAFTGNAMEPILLSEFKYGQDPLYGVAYNLGFGHTVRFEMQHLFTHLTITQMNPGIANEMYFTIPEEDDNYSSFHNAFKIDYNPETKELKGEFVKVESETYKDNNGKGLVFVSGETEVYEDEEEGGLLKSRVSFFLEPMSYHSFNLLYPRTREQTATYLTYTNDLSAQAGSDGLLPNYYYEFSVLKSLGSKVEENPEEGWDEKNTSVKVDVEKFLKAIKSGSPYSETAEDGSEIEILETYIDGTKLLRNIDFDYYFYDDLDNNGEGLLPDLSLNFDGNYHYIEHLACPLFNENNGQIVNLGIKNVRTDSKYQSNQRYLTKHNNTVDFSNNGIICRTNFGTISNVRVSDVAISLEVKTSGYSNDESSREAHSAGMLIGINRGLVRNLAIGDRMSLTVKNEANTSIMPNVVIGSIAGQNINSISGVNAIEDETNYESPEYIINNECQGATGVYLVGGIVGNNTGSISDAMLSSVTVDGTNSTGVESIMGGIVGSNSHSNGGAASIISCIVRGIVKAGETHAVTNLNSNSFTGGVAGSCHVQSNVLNSSAAIGVVGTQIYDNQVVYGTGGAFGRIEQTSGNQEIGEIKTIACFGSTLSGLQNIGNFAGLSAPGFDWEYYSGNDVNVKQYSQYDYIGAFR